MGKWRWKALPWMEHMGIQDIRYSYIVGGEIIGYVRAVGKMRGLSSELWCAVEVWRAVKCKLPQFRDFKHRFQAKRWIERLEEK